MLFQTNMTFFLLWNIKEKCVIDYIYMCTNNVIISNNQSKDLIAIRCLRDTSSCLQVIFIILIIHWELWLFLPPLFIYPILNSTSDELKIYSRCVTGHCFNLFAWNAKHISVTYWIFFGDTPKMSSFQWFW